MTIPLLTTKLYVPQPRPDLLSRPRLVERLEEGLRLGRRLTLLSAPAGYGKTTLIIDWAASIGASVAWLSVDEADNDPVRFWTYLVAALQRVEAGLGQGVPDALRSPQPPAVVALLTSLINQIDALDRDLVLVLDDYHLISTRAIHDALAFLIDRLPNNLHVAITSRADPPLPLARLRGRGELTELRQADLRFTPDEAADFLEHVSGIALPGDAIAALEERTEGWITGLQLAALSMHGREDVSGFISAFAGSNRYVLDYLTDEVLEHQPEGIRGFLLHTSILDRLSAPLCDELLQTIARESPEGSSASLIAPFPDSRTVLDHLEANNLFVVPLDDRRAWYRYHRLFADLLRAHLGELYPDRVPELHALASAWYEHEELLEEAMKHALAAGDPARAAQIVETHGRSLLFRGELTTLLQWIAALPEERIQASARICVTHAWALLLTGQFKPVEARLRKVEQIVSADDALLGDVAAIRAYVAGQAGDAARTIEIARIALERLSSPKLGERAVVFFVLGGAHLLNGNVPAAADAFRQAVSIGQEGGNLHLALPALNSLAAVQLSQGRLHEAQATAREALHLGTGPDGQPLPVVAGAISALAELAYEWNRLEEALAHADQSVELARLWGNADTLGAGYLTFADILLALGRLDAARDAMHEAERLSHDVTLFPSFSSLLRATQARLWLSEGDLAAARQWSEGAASETMGTMDLKETFALGQVSLALGRPEAALDVITALLETAQEQGLVAWRVRGLAMQALLDHGQGRKAPALSALATALTLAGPEGYVRSFVDLGPAMAPLLRQARSQGIAPDYVSDLLPAFGLTDGGPPRPVAQPLIEPLSARELEVLGLVAQGLSNREVGHRLHVAESTVKSHLNSVYGKLGVQNRTQATAKAKVLNLID